VLAGYDPTLYRGRLHKPKTVNNLDRRLKEPPRLADPKGERPLAFLKAIRHLPRAARNAMTPSKKLGF
jgi:hypothetical protein